MAPLLLDLLFWLGPQVSATPLFRQLADFYRQAANIEGLPAQAVQMSEQFATTLVESGEQSNLLSVLANLWPLHVPSLLARSAPVRVRTVIETENAGTALLLLIIFSLLGVLIGVIYMNLLAQRVPLGDGPKGMSVGSFAKLALRHWLMVLLYVLLVAVALIVAFFPVALVASLFSLISPFFSLLPVMLFLGTMWVIFFYFYFVVAALVLDNLPVHRAMMQSFVVVRNNFWTTLGFVVLTNLILEGFTYITASLAGMAPVGTLAAIVLHAYIGSGLAMALLVFYRTRVLKQEDRLVSVA